MLRGVLLGLALHCAIGASAAVTAGSLESHSSVSSSTVTSSKEHSRVANGHVLVINRVAHPLIVKAMRQARTQLENSGFAQKWEFIDAAQLKIHRTRQPDLFIVIDPATINEKGFLSRSIDATVMVRLGTDPYLSNHSRSTGEEPPLVRFKFEMTIDHKSTRKGIESEKYGSVSKEIATEIVKGLTNALKGVIEAHDVLPVLPDYMYGQYAPAPKFDFLGTAEAEFSGAGLMSHNESFWTFEVASNFTPELQAIKEILTGSGWRTDSAQITNTAPPDVYLTKGDTFIEIFPAESTSAFLSRTNIRKRLIFCYCEWFSKAERDEALARLLKEEPSAETLLMFEHNYSGRQRDELYARLKDSPVASPAGYLAIANYSLNKRDTNTARNMLLRAHAAQQTFARKKDMDDKIDEAWKKVARGEKLRVSASILTETGFIALTNGSVAAEKHADEPLLLFDARDSDKAPHTIALRIGAPKGTNRFHTIEVFQTYSGGSSSSTQPYDFRQTPQWQHQANYTDVSLRFTAKANPATNTFRLEVTKAENR